MFNVNSNLGGKYMDSFGNDQDNEPLLAIFFYFCINNAKNQFLTGGIKSLNHRARWLRLSKVNGPYKYNQNEPLHPYVGDPRSQTGRECRFSERSEECGADHQ